MSFLVIATALQVIKALLTPKIAEKFDYGKPFDENERLNHNDKKIEKEHREANDRFKEKHSNHENGKWINLLYQQVNFINLNMEL